MESQVTQDVCFTVSREDDCIWLHDVRSEPAVEVHLVPQQAAALANLLQLAADAEESFSSDC